MSGTARPRKGVHAPAGTPRRPRAGAATLVWLASYPKSGNTWTRVFLANYFANPAEPLPINSIRRFALSDADADLYQKVGGPRFDPGHPMQHLGLRPRVLAAIANNGADINFMKTHNVNRGILGAGLIPPALTRAAVYILRNPLDVAVSYARHFGMTPGEACRSISRSSNSTAGGSKNVKQFLSSWGEHVLSWTGASGFPVHVMRYEDMRADPAGQFRALLGALGIPADEDRLQRAVRFSSFDEMRRQEGAHGFVEASRNATRFFHSGSSGQWSGVLGAEDIAAVREANGAVMGRHGYQ